MVAEAATRSGIHLICVDRPGIGLSDFKQDRAVLDWPEDVTELADALGLHQFAIQGVSTGGAYACACAKRIPHRITALSIIAGLGSFDSGTAGMRMNNRLIFFIARRLPWLLRTFLWATIGRISRNEEKIEEFLLSMLAQLPEADQRVYLNPETRQQLVASIKEAFRQGSHGLAYEGKLITRPWGFELEEIACENLYLWHGVQDADIPISMARRVAAAIPGCKAKFFPDDGHISLTFRPEEIWEGMGLLETS
jgi:pimeloyl-ACP methyl ester carboxylesterase